MTLLVSPMSGAMKMKSLRKAAAASMILMAGTAIGCSKKEPQKTEPIAATSPTPAVAPPPPPADPAAEAQRIFKTRCTVCHGEQGAGDGPGAAAIVPKPRAFADAIWQTSVTDEHLAKIIVEGGPAVGKSPGMPANPDLKGKDDVVSALVRLIRSFRK